MGAIALPTGRHGSGGQGLQAAGEAVRLSPVPVLPEQVTASIAP